MTEIQFEFLDRISRVGFPADVVQEGWAGQWESWGLIGTAQANADELACDGLLEYLPAVTLERKYKLLELQALMPSRGVKPEGKKSELAKRLIEILPATELDTILGGAKCFVATPAGLLAIQAYRERKKQRRGALEAGVRSALLDGDVLRAARCIGNFDSAEAIKMSMPPHWQTGQLCTQGWSAKYLISRDYDDLPFAPSVRKAIGVELAVGLLIGDKSMVANILNATGGVFFCKPLEDFLKNDPCGRLAPEIYEEDEENIADKLGAPLSPACLASAYADTRQSEAVAEASLQQMIGGFSDDEFFHGVEILTAPTPCRICTPVKKKYRWSEVDTMPHLPLHWGCTCTYITWS